MLWIIVELNGDDCASVHLDETALKHNAATSMLHLGYEVLLVMCFFLPPTAGAFDYPLYPIVQHFGQPWCCFKLLYKYTGMVLCVQLYNGAHQCNQLCTSNFNCPIFII